MSNDRRVSQTRVNRNRRPLAQNPLENARRNIEPRVQEVRFLTAPGGIGNIGSSLQDLAKGLSAFGGALGSVGKKGGKAPKKPKGNADKLAKKLETLQKRADARTDKLAEEEGTIEEQFGGAIDVATEVSEVDVSTMSIKDRTALLQNAILQEGDEPIGEEIVSEDGTRFDTGKLPGGIDGSDTNFGFDLADNAEGFQQLVADGVIDATENPHFAMNTEKLSTDVLAQEMAKISKQKAIDLGSDLAIPESQAQQELDDSLSALTEFASGLNHRANIKKVGTTIFNLRKNAGIEFAKERRQAELYDNTVKFQAREQSNFDQFIENDFIPANQIQKTIKRGLDERRLLFPNALDSNLNYVQNNVIPYLDNIPDDKLERGLQVIDAIYNTDVNEQGALLGKVGQVNNLLDKARKDLTARLDNRDNPKDLDQEGPAKTNVINFLLAQVEENNQTNPTQLRDAAFEYIDANYSNNSFKNNLRNMVRNKAPSLINDLATPDNKLADQEIGDLLAKNRLLTAREKAVELYENGQISGDQFRSLNTKINTSEPAMKFIVDKGFVEKFEARMDATMNRVKDLQIPQAEKEILINFISNFYFNTYGPAVRQAVTEAIVNNRRPQELFERRFNLDAVMQEVDTAVLPVLEQAISSTSRTPGNNTSN